MNTVIKPKTVKMQAARLTIDVTHEELSAIVGDMSEGLGRSTAYLGLRANLIRAKTLMERGWTERPSRAIATSAQTGASEGAVAEIQPEELGAEP